MKATHHDFMLSGVILADTDSLESEVGATFQQGIHLDEHLIRNQIDLMREICSEVILVTSNPRHYLTLVDRSVRIITNLYPRRGRFGGMYSALSLCNNIQAWIVGSHMPYISPQAAQMMLRRMRAKSCGAILPHIGGRTFPLNGIYKKECVEAVSTLLARTSSTLQDLLDLISVQLFEEKGADMRFVQDQQTNPASV